MKVSEAEAITGGLSKPSKMPGFSYNLPAVRCLTGAKLVQIPGSTCAGCYALKGRYRFKNVKDAMQRRLDSLVHPQWTAAMTVQINSKLKHGHSWFRWHDSGDLQSVQHLKNIFEVCKATSGVKHWLPTREAQFLKLMDPDIVPPNLTIRFSSHMIGQRPVSFWPNTSTVGEDGANRTSHVQGSRLCPASKQGNQCRDCRACWDLNVPNVEYVKH